MNKIKQFLLKTIMLLVCKYPFITSRNIFYSCVLYPLTKVKKCATLKITRHNKVS